MIIHLVSVAISSSSSLQCSATPSWFVRFLFVIGSLACVGLHCCGLPQQCCTHYPSLGGGVDHPAQGRHWLCGFVALGSVAATEQEGAYGPTVFPVPFPPLLPAACQGKMKMKTIIIIIILAMAD